MKAEIYDDRPCTLGEGPLWHPERQQFFWFDIIGRKLLSRDASGPLEWGFDRIASAAGWIDRDRLLIGTETGLSVLDLTSGALTDLVEIEADNPTTRSNDGRADRQGGFWLGTMGKLAQTGAGAIWRWYRGELRKLHDGISITNAICFSPDGRTVHFADTAIGKVWRQALDADGWPVGEPELYLDLAPQGLNPDGAVIDADGGFCCAIWGEGAVLRFDPEGRQTHRFDVGGAHSSCPAFGASGEMLVTTATQGISDPDPYQGLTYLLRHDLRGLAEPRVIL
ncbi:SMP-30/gluconolactonase/LRE family protein [Paracoccus caeni]|uniref:SMP-30/gluconolactonase/LRE family protein n=1 Tax=Paracoccus caeni TaxID=657651 RepID=A0A934SG07_9RHOB|nr:SMP-30/gluconolactonase/LRE family protein [Paracoccus caeni]MBK4216729.1 SMP-30/gluconolactonase/LRE family protein [Paracoccus caeni]